jgi:uncharacterized protein YbjT (DUF2867 family)
MEKGIHGKVILVTGATGQQGGATARHLLARGWLVRALTRDKSKPEALTLEEAGAQIVEGDFEDRASLEDAMDGVYGVFSFQVPISYEAEIAHGKMIGEVAASVNVEQLVYSSVGGAERQTGIPHFESKWEIENYLRETGIPLTVLRPAYFMDNLNFKRAAILDGVYESIGMDPDKPLQMIASDDIGAIAASVFGYPEDYLPRAIEIAGDELTEPQIVKVLSDVIGREIILTKPEASSPYKDFLLMVDWFNREGYQADIAALRRQYPGIKTLREWLVRTGWGDS